MQTSTFDFLRMMTRLESSDCVMIKSHHPAKQSGGTKRPTKPSPSAFPFSQRMLCGARHLESGGTGQHVRTMYVLCTYVEKSGVCETDATILIVQGSIGVLLFLSKCTIFKAHRLAITLHRCPSYICSEGKMVSLGAL